MTKEQRTLALKIYDTISGQHFADWYGLVISDFGPSTNGDFDNHIRGEENCLNKEQILQQIVDMFRL